jgi:hypothetical protein
MRKIRIGLLSLEATGVAVAVVFAVFSAKAAESDPQEFTQIERGRCD